MTRPELQLQAADLVARLLNRYTPVYPGDDRPDAAVKAARAYARGEITDKALGSARAAAERAAAELEGLADDVSCLDEDVRLRAAAGLANAAAFVARPNVSEEDVAEISADMLALTGWLASLNGG